MERKNNDQNRKEQTFINLMKHQRTPPLRLKRVIPETNMTYKSKKTGGIIMEAKGSAQEIIIKWGNLVEKYQQKEVKEI